MHYRAVIVLSTKCVHKIRGKLLIVVIITSTLLKRSNCNVVVPIRSVMLMIKTFAISDNIVLSLLYDVLFPIDEYRAKRHYDTYQGHAAAHV